MTCPNSDDVKDSFAISYIRATIQKANISTEQKYSSSREIKQHSSYKWSGMELLQTWLGRADVQKLLIVPQKFCVISNKTCLKVNIFIMDKLNSNLRDSVSR